ncbi:peptidyl-tRNA hydrolase Pth2 [Bacteroides sp.]|uniref:peptidyl-tRNA hydrolase Pth2 n=1 Tax=Bacteroides sp. TaxID=29523 RepID=UPI00261952D6|nr:peptidyl-tRNA hydrolase Pth2 [Bacteroides sp.]MDD3039624.1 peptidyl-tRNA hydrolase Pth2 [Bacteroides sp.]
MKQVIIVREDLGMSCGKMVAQAAHAAVNAVRNASESDVNEWIESGYKKIALAVDSVLALEQLAEAAKTAGLPFALITDFGYTEVAPGTVTALGIGPAEDAKVNRITKKLRLL